jgi:hypothetical protein
MEYVITAVVCLLLGFFGGSQYRKARMAGNTRVQSLKGIVIQGGGGPPPVK